MLGLFADEDDYPPYRYSTYITNLTLSFADIWRLYRDRGGAENRIKELRYDVGVDSFNMNSFSGTEAPLIFAMPGYKLMELLRQFLHNSKAQHPYQHSDAKFLPLSHSSKRTMVSTHLT